MLTQSKYESLLQGLGTAWACQEWKLYRANMNRVIWFWNIHK